jgi:hypothetical protein
MNNAPNLKLKIMKRVYGFWFLRSILPLFIIEFLAIGAGLYLVARFVFVSSVFQNALVSSSGRPLFIISYLWGAFMRAGFPLQALIVILLGVLGFILRDVNRSLISYALMRRSEYLNKRGSHE